MTTLSNVMPFTKQDILDAYERLAVKGIKPDKGTFYSTNDDGCRACAIGAYVLDKELLTIEETSKAFRIHETINMDNGVMWAFIAGFDTDENITEPQKWREYNEAETTAWQLGKELQIELGLMK